MEFKNKYRIVTDRYNGYSAQVKRWWFPLKYFEIGDRPGHSTNSQSSLEETRGLIEKHKNGLLKVVPFKSVVAYRE